MSRKTLILVLVALVPAAIGIGGYLVETDAERIARVADECRMAFLAGDAERVLVHIEEDAVGDGLAGGGPLRKTVRRWVDLANGRLKHLSLDRGKIVVDGEEARGEWIVTLRGRQGMRGRFGIVINFARGPAGWLVRHADVSDSLPD